MMTLVSSVSDTPNCLSVIYHARVIIYDHTMFILQATGLPRGISYECQGRKIFILRQ
jgi:hypothetical protein